MFYEVTIKSHIRVAPTSFKENTTSSVLKSLTERFDGYISNELGFVIGVAGVDDIGEGIIIPGDGAAYYETTFRIYTFKPELQEVVLGKISDITDFGAFIDIGAIDGMIHISQAMDDFVSFSKGGSTLSGKETKKVLRIKDICRARIIAVSYKDIANPKIGLTMRQNMLGNVKWVEEEIKKEKTRVAKAKKEGKK